MPSDQTLLTLILGPAGLTVGLLYALWKFQRGDWVPRERLDEKDRHLQDALKLLDKAASGSAEIAAAIAERNRLETERIAALRGSPSLSQELADTESRIRRPRS